MSRGAPCPPGGQRHARAAGLCALLATLMAGCASVPVGPAAPRPPAPTSDTVPADSDAGAGTRDVPAPVASPRPDPRPATRRTPRGGGYYLDDGPDDNPPAHLASVPDAVPRAEPLHPAANRPYVVFGRRYVPQADVATHRERGHASWYGRKFHGRKTSSGERYDMYGMTAAHPTLPIPSYVRVTNLRNGRAVVLRVNDRGPFLKRRVIDLSYTAAYKLGYVDGGSAEVEVELLAPGPVARGQQTAVRADVADESAPSLTMAVPMLAEAAAERLSIETTIDDRPIGGERPVSPSDASASALGALPGPAPQPADDVATQAPAVPAIWLQLGAFSSRDNAESARARFVRELPWLAVPIEVLRLGDGWRVQVGPWARRHDAISVAERIASGGTVRPITVLR
jgi:rare lipoprotein A